MTNANDAQSVEGATFPAKPLAYFPTGVPTFRRELSKAACALGDKLVELNDVADAPEGLLRLFDLANSSSIGENQNAFSHVREIATASGVLIVARVVLDVRFLTPWLGNGRIQADLMRMKRKLRSKTEATAKATIELYPLISRVEDDEDDGCGLVTDAETPEQLRWLHTQQHTLLVDRGGDDVKHMIDWIGQSGILQPPLVVPVKIRLADGRCRWMLSTFDGARRISLATAGLEDLIGYMPYLGLWSIDEKTFRDFNEEDAEALKPYLRFASSRLPNGFPPAQSGPKFDGWLSSIDDRVQRFHRCRTVHVDLVLSVRAFSNATEANPLATVVNEYVRFAHIPGAASKDWGQQNVHAKLGLEVLQRFVDDEQISDDAYEDYTGGRFVPLSDDPDRRPFRNALVAAADLAGLFHGIGERGNSSINRMLREAAQPASPKKRAAIAGDFAASIIPGVQDKYEPTFVAAYAGLFKGQMFHTLPVGGNTRVTWRSALRQDPDILLERALRVLEKRKQKAEGTTNDIPSPSTIALIALGGLAMMLNPQGSATQRLTQTGMGGHEGSYKGDPHQLLLNMACSESGLRQLHHAVTAVTAPSGPQLVYTVDEDGDLTGDPLVERDLRALWRPDRDHRQTSPRNEASRLTKYTMAREAIRTTAEQLRNQSNNLDSDHPEEWANIGFDPKLRAAVKALVDEALDKLQEGVLTHKQYAVRAAGTTDQEELA